jgi:hypothetical protein
MIEARLATTLLEKKLVVDSMKDVGDINMFLIYGIWQDNICVGGAGLSGVFKNEFSIGFNCKPSISLGKTICFILSEVLKVKPQIKGQISKFNVKCKKLAIQVGFKIVYQKNDIIFYELSNLSDKLKKRW